MSLYTMIYSTYCILLLSDNFWKGSKEINEYGQRIFNLRDRDELEEAKTISIIKRR
jgi:hypothetical protein